MYHELPFEREGCYIDIRLNQWQQANDSIRILLLFYRGENNKLDKIILFLNNNSAQAVAIVDNLKIFTTKSIRVEKEMKLVAEKYIKTAGLEEFMRVNENGRNIKILVKSGITDSQIRELLMFVEGAKNDDTVLMSLSGNFDLNEISILTDKKRIPGGDDLKKATKNKR